jgi:DNA-binding NarL/FixJ family response regulator
MLNTSKLRINILLIEDSKPDTYIIKRVLGTHMRYSCHVLHAACMADAEFILEGERDVDVIILDLRLPDTDSDHDTLQRLKNIKLSCSREAVPVVILTGVDDAELACEMIDLGAKDYVRKSLIIESPEILCKIIEGVLPCCEGLPRASG